MPRTLRARMPRQPPPARRAECVFLGTPGAACSRASRGPNHEAAITRHTSRPDNPSRRIPMALPALAASFLTAAAISGVPGDAPDARTTRFPNASGVSATLSKAGAIDGSNPFFQSLGSNGRSCASCHQPATGWSVTPQFVLQRFNETAGLDPIFRTNDGANSPHADVSTPEARRKAYSMLLGKGLIRVGIGIPAGAEFELSA